MRCYRLCSGRHRSDSGRGAALNGGRWNPIGVEAIYASATASLAALEVLAHFAVLPRDFVLTEIQIPDGTQIEIVGAADLPADWQALLPVPATQELGRKWAAELRSVVLSVPSSILPDERNFLINPLHPAFGAIKFVLPKPLSIRSTFKVNSFSGDAQRLREHAELDGSFYWQPGDGLKKGTGQRGPRKGASSHAAILRCFTPPAFRLECTFHHLPRSFFPPAK